MDLKKERFHGLDGWRAVLLVMGVGTHAITAPTGAYQWVAVTTHLFRMEAFFGVSGFLAAVALQRKAPLDWLRSRLVVLGVPMILAMLVLNPASEILLRWAAAIREDRPIDLAHLRPMFGHVWFLWILILCSITAIFIKTSKHALITNLKSRGRDITAVFPSKVWWPALILILVIVLGSLVAIEQQFHSMKLSCSVGSNECTILYVVGESRTILFPYYLIIFLLGMGIAVSDDLRRGCIDFWKLHAAIAIIGIAGVMVSYYIYGSLIYPYIYAGAAPFYVWAAKVVIGIPAALIILRHGILARYIPPILRELARASYTIYIIHFMLTSIIILLLGPTWWGSMLHYLNVVGIVVAWGYITHVTLVEPYSWASLLINGKHLFGCETTKRKSI
jgi:glucans biosynthesis protein C